MCLHRTKRPLWISRTRQLLLLAVQTLVHDLDDACEYCGTMAIGQRARLADQDASFTNQIAHLLKGGIMAEDAR